MPSMKVQDSFAQSLLFLADKALNMFTRDGQFG